MDGFKPNGPQSRFKEQQNFQHKQPLATPEAPKGKLSIWNDNLIVKGWERQFVPF